MKDIIIVGDSRNPLLKKRLKGSKLAVLFAILQNFCFNNVVFTDKVTREQVCEQLKISSVTFTDKIRELKEDGILIPSRARARYYINDKWIRVI